MTRDEILSMAREAGYSVRDKTITVEKRPKPDHMTDEAWRQLTEVIPFRIQQVENGHHMSLAVIVSSCEKIACELGIQEDVRQACWPFTATDQDGSDLAKERTARIEAQQRLADAQELAAKSGLAHRKAVHEAVAKATSEAVAAEREACANVVTANGHMFATQKAAESLANDIRARGTP